MGPSDHLVQDTTVASLTPGLHSTPSRKTKMTIGFLALAIMGTSVLSGCGLWSEKERRTARSTGIGAAVGGVGGAIVAGAAGGSIGGGLAIGSALGALGGFIWSSQMESQRRDFERDSRSGGYSVSRTSDNRLQLSVPNNIAFDPGSARIKRPLIQVLDRFARTLQRYPSSTIILVGHTDGSLAERNNPRLSIARAENVRDQLVSQGIPASRIRVDGAGSKQPIDNNNTAEGRERNRRVDIYVGEQDRAASQQR